MREFIEQLARQAGEMALAYRGRLASLQVNRKSEKDLVTEADTAIERYLVAEIRARYPEHGITGEESGSRPGDTWRWVIDPIDGTASFVHDQPYFSISIALEQEGRTLFGAVHAPALGELYLAERGEGAWLNGRRLHVSQRDCLGDAMLATGFACLRAGLPRHNLPLFNALLPRLRDVRRYGSAALDLCFVAAGRLEGYWELNLSDYDVAAGMLMVEEAGGRCTDFQGGRDRLYAENLATNGLIHEQVIAVFREAMAAAE